MICRQYFTINGTAIQINTDKNKIKISSYIRKFRMEQLHDYVYMISLLIYGEIFAHFLIY
jgi:hypothetical protein